MLHYILPFIIIKTHNINVLYTCRQTILEVDKYVHSLSRAQTDRLDVSYRIAVH